MLCARGQLSLVEADHIWLAKGRFDPELLLSRLSDFQDSAGAQGWSGVRIIAEISPAIPEIPGGGRLIEFEVEVNRLLHNRPMAWSANMICAASTALFSWTCCASIPSS